MRRANLRRLLNARSLVFVGGRNIVEAVTYCRTLGFAGRIQVVSPRREEVAGIPAVPRLQDLEAVPDAAFVAVPGAANLAVIKELRSMGVAGTICYAAGFAESGPSGTALQARLVAAAGDMALIGPNTLGAVNFVGRVGLVHADHGPAGCAAGAAIVAQSGTVGGNALRSERALPVTHLLAVGNQAVVDLADAVTVLAEDPAVRVIMLHLEGIRDALALQAALRAATGRGVPVVIFRTGVSAQARAIAVSHTGGMTGAGALLDQLLCDEGALIAESFDGFVELGKLLAQHPRGLAGRRLLVFTASGADAGHAADLAAARGLELAPPSAAGLVRLAEILPPIATAGNPMDVTMALWGDEAGQRQVYRLLLAERYDAAVMVINYPSSGPDTSPALLADFDGAVAALIAARAGLAVPIFAASNLAEGLPPAVRARLLAAGIVPLQGLEAAFAALAQAADLRRDRSAAGSGLVAAGRPIGATRTLDEWASKAWLRAAGIATPRSALVQSPQEAAAEARAIGYPVVLKAVGPDLAHKSEQGAVVLGLRDENTLRNAARRLLALPGAEALLVEAQVGDAVAEVILGATRDPVFGMTLLVGAGGVLAELIADRQLFLLPLEEETLRRRLPALKVWPLLQGYRGRPAGDCEALIAAIMVFASHLERDAERVVECDVNPLLVRPQGQGVVAVDALLRIAEEGGPSP